MYFKSVCKRFSWLLPTKWKRKTSVDNLKICETLPLLFIGYNYFFIMPGPSFCSGTGGGGGGGRDSGG
jgi:hypothetical protein